MTNEHVDTNGATRARLNMSTRGPVLVLTDANGKMRTELAVVFEWARELLRVDFVLQSMIAFLSEAT